MNYYFSNQYSDELYHYGVKGMKWGVRKQRDLIGHRSSGSDAHYREQRARRLKRAAIIGSAIAVTALAGYGAYKVSKIRSANTTAVETWLLKNGHSTVSKYSDGSFDSRLVKRSSTLLGPRLDINQTNYSKKYGFEDSYNYVIGSKSKPRRVATKSRYVW